MRACLAGVVITGLKTHRIQIQAAFQFTSKKVRYRPPRFGQRSPRLGQHWGNTRSKNDRKPPQTSNNANVKKPLNINEKQQ